MTRETARETARRWLDAINKASEPVWVGSSLLNSMYVFTPTGRLGSSLPATWVVVGYGTCDPGVQEALAHHFRSAREALEWTHTWMLMHVPDYDGAVGEILEMMQGRDTPWRLDV